MIFAAQTYNCVQPSKPISDKFQKRDKSYRPKNFENELFKNIEN